MTTEDDRNAKLNEATRIAEKAATSDDVATRLGAVVIYAGQVDFAAIQAARLMDQIDYKQQRFQAGASPAKPRDDQSFYGRRTSTSSIFRDIESKLPFRTVAPASPSEATRMTKLANEMIEAGFVFLGYKNALVRQLGRPDRTFNDAIEDTDRIISSYRDFIEAHAKFFTAASPYR